MKEEDDKTLLHKGNELEEVISKSDQIVSISGERNGREYNLPLDTRLFSETFGRMKDKKWRYFANAFWRTWEREYDDKRELTFEWLLRGEGPSPRWYEKETVVITLREGR